MRKSKRLSYTAKIREVAEAMLGQSLKSERELENFRPIVEEVIEGHKRLQRYNHFSEKLALAYDGRA